MSRMGVFSVVSCALAMAGCATPVPVSPEALKTAQCMADVANTIRGFGQVRPSVMWDHVGLKATVDISIFKHSGTRQIRLWLSQAPMRDGYYYFESTGGAVEGRGTDEILLQWETKCRVRDTENETEPVLVIE